MSDDLISKLMAAVPEPMVHLDAAGQVAAANDAALSLLGDWILGRNHVTVLRQPALLERIEATYRDGTLGEARFVQSGQAGQTIYRVRVSLLPESDTDPGYLADASGVILHFDDVTHLREAEEMRRDFVANVSHELRTPLTAILGFIETLRGPAKADTEAQARFLTIMEDEARRMNRIVSDLLSLSRVEGQERMRPDDVVELDQLLETVVTTLRPLAQERGNDIHLHGVGARLELRGDGDQLMQVFLNLTENALKYGRPGRPVTLKVTEAIESGSLKGPVYRIDVIDEGEGIDPVHLPRLTERFYRADTHRSRALGGTGLGLAIVKHIVNRHRGRMRISSEKGIGSTFSVTLPKG